MVHEVLVFSHLHCLTSFTLPHLAYKGAQTPTLTSKTPALSVAPGEQGWVLY